MLKIILNFIQLFAIMEPAQNLYFGRANRKLTKNASTNNGLLNKHKARAHFHNKIIMPTVRHGWVKLEGKVNGIDGRGDGGVLLQIIV